MNSTFSDHFTSTRPYIDSLEAGKTAFQKGQFESACKHWSQCPAQEKLSVALAEAKFRLALTTTDAPQKHHAQIIPLRGVSSIWEQ